MTRQCSNMWNCKPNEPDKLVTTTVQDYNLSETSKLIKGVFPSVAMMAFFCIYLKYSQSLFVQAIMASKSLYEAKTVKIHVLPMVTSSGHSNQVAASSVDLQTDRAASEEAEKCIGAKKEDLVDLSLDPKLTMTLQMSMEEEAAFQAAAHPPSPTAATAAPPAITGLGLSLGWRYAFASLPWVNWEWVDLDFGKWG
ncbi:phosphate transport-domain-containing protein [Lactarius quietus]|nr:phosphate transport-domain-containing protein [Lactarius quietus]